MKVLLINPPDIAAMSRRSERILSYLAVLRRGRLMPPLGLCSLAAVLRRAGFSVAILDADVLGLSVDHVAHRIRALRPDVVGLTVMTNTLNPTYRICRAAKSIDPRIVTILGGPQVTVMPAETVDHPAVDVAALGEAEQIIVPLIQAARDRRLWPRIPGLVYREDGRTVQTGPSQHLTDLDALPMPAIDLVPVQRYYDSSARHYPVISMMTARGCPFRCLFCELEVVGRRLRPFSAERVVDEMEMLADRYGAREIAFYDDTFSASKAHARRICEEILRRGVRVPWTCRTRVDCVTPELLRLMKRAGCHRVSYGIESASQRVLDILRKRITPEQSRAAIRWTHEAGMTTVAFYMLGSPGDTRETMEETIRFSLELGADFTAYTVTVAWPGTDMWDLLVARGLADRDYWAEYVRNEGVLTRPLPTFAREPAALRYVRRLNRQAYRRYYLRPGYVLRRLQSLRSPGDLLWQARLAAGILGL